MPDKSLLKVVAADGKRLDQKPKKVREKGSRFRFDDCQDGLIVNVPFPDQCYDLVTLCTWQRTFPVGGRGLLRLGPTKKTGELVELEVQVRNWDLQKELLTLGVLAVWKDNTAMTYQELAEFLPDFPDQEMELVPVWHCIVGTKKQLRVAQSDFPEK